MYATNIQTHVKQIKNPSSISDTPINEINSYDKSPSMLINLLNHWMKKKY